MCALFGIKRLVILASLAVVGWSAQSVAEPAVTGIRIGDYPSKTRIVLELSEATTFHAFTLPDPYRVVIDLPEVDWKLSAKKPTGRVVSAYRFGLFKAGTSRLVVDVRRPVKIVKSFSLRPSDNHPHRVVVDMRPVTRSAFMLGLAPPPRVKPLMDSYPRKRVLEPKTRPLIALDPGHGGVDPGTIGASGLQEKRIVLIYARELRRELLATKRYKVVLTRNRDVYIPLRQRIAIARRKGADLFISIHADAIANRQVRGGSIYTLSERASDSEAAALAARENKSDVIAGIDLSVQSKEVANILIDLAQRKTMNQSAAFAQIMTSELSKKVRMLRRSHRFAGFAVLKAPDVPSVLFEIGYLSNRKDEKALRSRNYRKKSAQSVVRAIDAYFARQHALNKP